jgi:hypothetical protein
MKRNKYMRSQEILNLHFLVYKLLYRLYTNNQSRSEAFSVNDS